MDELKALQKKIDRYINEKQLSSSFQTKLTEKGLMVTILENILFDSGKADVKLESLGIAKEMSSLLVSASPREITVSGHTDNVPIANAQFASNWELSTRQAVNFMQVLLQNKNYNQKNLVRLDTENTVQLLQTIHKKERQRIDVWKYLSCL